MSLTSRKQELLAGISPPQPRQPAEKVEINGHYYVTQQHLATMLGVGIRTLSRWDASRIGPPRITVGKTILYNEAKLPDWLASHEIAHIEKANRRPQPAKPSKQSK
jgi:hypothetical protein